MNKFGNAPLGKMIFMNDENQKEWDSMSQDVKKFAMKNIRSVIDKMENRLAIETLCLVVNELVERIEALENSRSLN